MTATPKHPDNRENGANTLQKYNFFLNVPNKMKQKKNAAGLHGRWHQ